MLKISGYLGLIVVCSEAIILWFSVEMAAFKRKIFFLIFLLGIWYMQKFSVFSYIL